MEKNIQENIQDLKNNKKFGKITILFLILAFAFVVFNQFQLFNLGSTTNSGTIPTGLAVAEASDIIPKGTPRIYGEEFGITYNYVSPDNPELADQAISFLGNLDRTIELTGTDQERYVDITSQISCEYCCGAKSIIFTKEDAENLKKNIVAAIEAGKITEEQAKQYKRNAGETACGCAHSFAMRGLAKYLVKEHGTEFTNDEILEELAKWKTLFFPGQMVAKAQILKEKGIEFNYINLGSNKYRDIEKGAQAGSGMVGGC